MGRAVALLLSVCTALWIDALAGGRLATTTVAIVVVAALALLVGLIARPWLVALSALAGAALVTVADQVADPGRFSSAGDGVFYLVVVAGPAAAGWLIGAWRRQVRTLSARRRDLEARRELIVGAALAREFDQVNRRVDLALTDHLARIDARLPELVGAPSAAALEAVQTTARAALDELRGVLGVLHAPTPTSEDAHRRTVASGNDIVASAGARRRSPRPGPVDLLLVAALIPLAVETTRPGVRGPWWVNLLAALAQGMALVLLRRRAVIGTVALTALACTQSAFFAPLPPTVSWLVPGLLAAFLLGLATDRRTGIVGVLILGLGVLAMAYVTPGRHTSGLVPSEVMGLLAFAAGWAASRARTRANELTAITDELARTQDAAGAMAAAERRGRLAAELHDVGAHALTVVCLHAQAALAWWDTDPTRASDHVAALVGVLHGPIAELRRSLDHLDEAGTPGVLDIAALEALASTSRAVGLRVRIDVDPATASTLGDLSDDVAMTVYRVVQESLTNAAKHAGRTDVVVTIRRAEGRLDVRVSDEGRPHHGADLDLPVPGGGFGLAGLGMRVRDAHGQFRAGPSGAGFAVSARLPA